MRDRRTSTLLSPVHPGQLQSAAASPAPQVAVVAPAAIPTAPEPTSARSPEGSRTPVVIGLALAVIGLVALGLFWLNHREEHRNVPIVDDPPKDAGALLVDDDGDPNTPPVIVSVAPLVATEAPPHGHDGGRRRHHEGGAEHAPTPPIATTPSPPPTPQPTPQPTTPPPLL
jgi:hypothetical protein